MKEEGSVRCKRALSGIENECVIFELEDGVCVLSNVNPAIRPIFNLLPASFARHMPYAHFVPARELTQSTVNRAKANVEALEGRFYGYSPEKIASARPFLLRDFPEEG